MTRSTLSRRAFLARSALHDHDGLDDVEYAADRYR